MRVVLLIITSLCLQCAKIYTQSAAEQIIHERMVSDEIPGIAYLIARDGQIIEEGYFGKASLEHDVDITAESIFAIASMSKTYTAAAVLILAERGMLKLDDSVKKYIPEAPRSWEPMTVRHLLTHSSGLEDDWALYDWNQSNQLFLQTNSDSLFLGHLFGRSLLYEPGTSHSYSCGPFVLGVIIERITGQFYGDFLNSSIF